MSTRQLWCRRAAFSAGAVALAVLSAGSALACSVMPEAPDPKKLVRDTNMIVLARVIGIEVDSEYVEYRFKVVDTLKGDQSVIGRFVRTELRPHDRIKPNERDFDRHRDPRFWKGQIDRRSGMRATCMFDQAFTMGRTYPIFRGQRVRRAAELIESKNDRWLTTVRRLARGY